MPYRFRLHRFRSDIQLVNDRVVKRIENARSVVRNTGNRFDRPAYGCQCRGACHSKQAREKQSSVHRLPP